MTHHSSENNPDERAASEGPTEDQGPPDIELVAQTQAGNSQAFDHLVVRYQRRIYSVIMNMIGNHADTNDLMMETFLKAYRHIHRFKGNAAFYTWIYRIAINQTINFLRKNKNRRTLSIDEEELDHDRRKEFIDSTKTADVERQSNLSELQKKLNESLTKLSKHHRIVVTLFDIEGMSHAEIAKIMKCSEGTVRSRLFYAHKKLQKYLREYK